MTGGKLTSPSVTVTWPPTLAPSIHSSATPVGSASAESVTVAETVMGASNSDGDSGEVLTVVVENHSGWDGTFFVYGTSPDEVGGDRTDYPSLSPLPIGPTRWYVGCSSDGSADKAVLTTVRVVDPDGNWRRPRLGDDCRYSGSIFGPGGEGPTEQAALTDLLRTQDGERVRLYDEGYWRTPGHAYVMQPLRHGEALLGGTYLLPDGTWRASADGTCDPAVAARLLSRGWLPDPWDPSLG